MQIQKPSNKSRVIEQVPEANAHKVNAGWIIETQQGILATGTTEREAWRHARRKLERTLLASVVVDAVAS